MAAADLPPLTTHRVLTIHGTISVMDTTVPSAPPTAPALLLIHGNSSCSRIFTPLLCLSASSSFSSSSPALAAYRTLALDLPGHGASSDAPDPSRSYTQAAYAEMAVQVLDALQVDNVVVLGWSLGGHVAIEMVPLLEPSGRLKGIMIVGSPPSLGVEQVSRGFKGRSRAEADEEEQAHMNLAATEAWTEEDYDTFPFESVRGPREPWVREMAVRTDGRARKIMFDAFEEGRGVDQRKVLGESEVPCAVLNGGDEPFIDLEYVDAVEYKNLWEGKCHRLEGLGHAPFWEKPEVVLPYWERFVSDCSA